MRLILILLVAALVYDAVANDSATTKRVWAEIVDFFDSNSTPGRG
ncbi:MAG: hypothetical protein QM698_12570 [Micropepsaceae bacterium]